MRAGSATDSLTPFVRPDAVFGQVGSIPDPNAAIESVNLVIPLNEKASKLFAKRSEITLALRLRDAERRAPLKVRRAYLRTGE